MKPMKLLEKIKQKFSTEEKCYICGKVISAKKNPESIKITFGYSKQNLLFYDFGETVLIIEPEFYLCKQHREDFEQFILSLRIKEIERKTGKKIPKPINITVDVHSRAYLENGKEVELNQAYDQWTVKPNLDKGILEFEVNGEKVETNEKPNPMVNAELSHATFQNERKESKKKKKEMN